MPLRFDPLPLVGLAALRVERRSRGLIPAQAVLFLAVGLTGLWTHMITLSLAGLAGAPLWLGQALAIWAAMSGDFLLNNHLTFRKQRLRGPRALAGLLRFYLSCLAGALSSEAAALLWDKGGVGYFAAGVLGAVVGGLINLTLAQTVVWREPTPAQRA